MCKPLVCGMASGLRRRLAVLGLLALLGACAGAGGGETPAMALTPLAATVPADPVAAFAATAAPGDRGTVIADGLATPVRLGRSYAAASGRECREVLLGGGIEERVRLVCRDPGGWAPTRPLLRGALR